MMKNKQKSKQDLNKLLVEVRDILALSADYLFSKVSRFKGHEELHLICAIYSNMHRAAHQLEMHLQTQGLQAKQLPYQAKSFQHNDVLDINITEFMQDFLDKQEQSMQKNKASKQS